MSATRRTSVSTAHFDRAYRSRTDPWGTLHKPYEQEKFADTASLLPAGRRFGSALEIGCGAGALTRLLAPHCEELLATDCSAAAVEQARATCADLEGVSFATLRVPEDLSDGQADLDLVVMSEVGYYLSDADLHLAARRIRARLRPGGHLLLAHWVHEGPGDVMTGRGVHEAFRAVPGTVQVDGRDVSRYGETYRLDLLRRAP
ncbi:SAM-dependent methyltransferase [Streptomyces sp. NRRL F-2664]|uniref:SAM-dependent methyltransferase n=1 Tax=Streptomyces sp. NRRL F-2664 TaxID=1463842 RepID=UPI0004C56F05|nr:SAM-dependent methyltransferase [Streptomyces sp. NRRL F-2664]